MNSQHETYINKFQHSKLSLMIGLLFLDFVLLIEY